MGDLQLVDWLAIWVVVGPILLLVQRRWGQGAGLVTAYALELIVLHWLAAAIYMMPGYVNLDLGTVISGLRQSTFAFVGYSAGALIAILRAGKTEAVLANDPNAVMVDTKRIRTYLLIGIIAYMVLTPLLRGVPTISAVVAAASGFVVVALALACWNATQSGRTRTMLVWLGFTASLPFITIAAEGFMGYGLAASAVVFAFVGSFYRGSWRTLVVSVLAVYVGLSLYVTYMRDRQDIRDVVWTGSAASARVEQVQNTFLDFELFNPNNIDHLYRIDVRLNQDFMVGAAVERLERGIIPYANGETVQDAILSLIPRALWPDKPFTAGSGDLVTRFTGIRFAEGTSVGIGQVMEWYVNFGTLGVFFGFLLFGWVLASIDRLAGVMRDRGEWGRFASWFLPGMSMLQVGGSLVEVTAAAAAAALVAYVVRRIIDPPNQQPRVRKAPRFDPALLEEQP